VHPGSDTPLVYSFRFPFTSGWYDASNGTAALGFAGAVRFLYSAHTIDFTIAAPAVEIGPASRALAGYQGPTAGPLAGQRAVLVDLNPAAGARTVSADGKTITYTTIPATIPAGSAGVFGGFYAPGDPFGSMTVSFTTP
jgi:hypothetical protein